MMWAMTVPRDSVLGGKEATDRRSSCVSDLHGNHHMHHHWARYGCTLYHTVRACSRAARGHFCAPPNKPPVWLYMPLKGELPFLLDAVAAHLVHI